MLSWICFFLSRGKIALTFNTIFFFHKMVDKNSLIYECWDVKHTETGFARRRCPVSVLSKWYRSELRRCEVPWWDLSDGHSGLAAARFE